MKMKERVEKEFSSGERCNRRVADTSTCYMQISNKSILHFIKEYTLCKNSS